MYVHLQFAVRFELFPVILHGSLLVPFRRAFGNSCRSEKSMSAIHPFDESGIIRDASGVARYQGLQPSLVAMLRASVEQSPKSDAIVEASGPRVTYRELWDRAARIAGGLRQLGIGRGDRVAIRLGNGLDWCLAFFGIQLAGAIAVPVNTRFSESETEYVVSDSGSKYVFLPGAPLPEGPSLAVDDLSPNDVSAIFYTSGTTGFPKGAVTTHDADFGAAVSCDRLQQSIAPHLRRLWDNCDHAAV